MSSTAEQILRVFDGQAGEFVIIDMAGAIAFFDPTLSLYNPEGVSQAYNGYS